jgi:hypothetical protein
VTDAKAREYFSLADGEQLFREALASRLDEGTGVTEGSLAITDARFIFRGAQDDRGSFSIPLTEISGAVRSGSGKVPGNGKNVLDLRTADQTFRIYRSSDFEPHLKGALAAAGRSVSDGAESWTVS